MVSPTPPLKAERVGRSNMWEKNGIFHFEGGEDDDVFLHLWACLTDLSWYGMIETILRIIFKRPPKRYWEIVERKKDLRNE